MTSTVISIVQSNVVQDVTIVDNENQQPQTSLLSPNNEAPNTINNPYNRYQEAPQPYNNLNRTSRPYRGFSTSICSMFTSSPRIDCCSLAFCGLLQWDYNYYLITHEQPPSLWNRAFRHIFVPLSIFLAAAYCATNIKDQKTNELSVTILILLLIAYIIIDCIMERMKRVNFRKRLIDTLNDSGNTVYQQTTADYFCAHRICGFYTCDDENDFESDTSTNDLCSSLWQCFSSVCCSKCHCWLQCCGICATAQEGREIALYVGKEGTLLDYVTFEPFSDYFPAIAHLRYTQNNNLWDHYGALSNLSGLLWRTLWICFGVMALLAVLDYQKSFTWGNLLVFLATFTQAFIIIYFVHWKWNRFDLSLDAVIKYFASGFLISTTLAIFFETIESLVFNIFFNILVLVTNTSNDDNLNMVWNKNGILLKMRESLSDGEISAGHLVIVIVYLFCTSFFVAALVEEMCKYYGFLVVDHPDMFQDCSIFLNNLIADDTGDEEDGELSSHESSDKVQNDELVESNAVTSPLATPIVMERKLNSMGSAITIAMVTVAMGFACCENLVYIFIYTGGGAGMEIATLIARSLFPVHPLCAAIQSINVCRRILEKDDSYGVGYIILPSLLLHGFFDFSLMLIALFTTDHGEDENEADGEDGAIGLLSFLLAFGIVLFGFIYYYVESNRQKKRLNALEASGNTVSLI